MAGKNIGHVSQTITAVGATGTVTVTSAAGFYKGAIVWLNDSSATAANNKRAIITSISSNTLGVRLQDIVAGSVPTYGNSSMAAYNGGTITQHEQFIYNVDEAPLT